MMLVMEFGIRQRCRHKKCEVTYCKNTAYVTHAQTTLLLILCFLRNIYSHYLWMLCMEFSPIELLHLYHRAYHFLTVEGEGEGGGERESGFIRLS